MKPAVRTLRKEGHHNAVTFDDIDVGRGMILKCRSKGVKRIEVLWDKVWMQVFVFHKMEFFFDNVSIFC